ncbi:hypothetical protein [Streptomyces erythrochromogenes]|uniref:hypothetical protein n=1 Tax=Streptomyces erythrochromogenes TaxID=285574 RepID=UPI003428A2F4
MMIAIFMAVVLPLMLSEFFEWGPALARRITLWAARRLGASEAIERYSEEWLAELEEIPGKLSPLLFALSHLVHLPQIRLQLRRRRRSEALPSIGTVTPSPRPVPIPHLLILNGTAWKRAEALASMMRARQGILECGFFVVTEAARPDLSEALHQLRSAIRRSSSVTSSDGTANRGPRLDDSAFRDRLAHALAADTFFIVAEEDESTLRILADLQLSTPIIIGTQEHAVIHTHPNRYKIPWGQVTESGVLQSILETD